MDKMPETSGRAGAREAILAAFRDIVLQNGYDRVRVLDIVQRSGIARSTFYEHFQSREDLLLYATRRPLQLLAQLAGPKPDTEKAALVLAHFVENREFALSIMDGHSAGALRRLLAEMIAHEEQFPASLPDAVAGAQLAVITSWLERNDGRSAQQVAAMLRDVTARLIR